MASPYQYMCGALLLAGVACAVPANAQVDASRELRPALGRDESTTEFLRESAADGAQVVTKPEGPAPTPRHTGIKAMVKDLGADIIHLPSKENLFLTAVGEAWRSPCTPRTTTSTKHSSTVRSPTSSSCRAK